MQIRKISFWGDIAFTILASAVVIACFFNPQLFVENKVLRIIVLVGGGLLPLKYALKSARHSRELK
ncbi:hypothetical protein [Alteromonas sp. PRIM-21]|uniref:hypothetical protein n=1 Tax=Alteromonas sp. PRIM-21 TaxID=1454978 RepID=UPI0022B950FE|nr:hypothetical protein [Alteromonas sp. PRIM-21]MCZ8530832.1 hypothetical protein [Alteromonas sp. PRIM-21]